MSTFNFIKYAQTANNNTKNRKQKIPQQVYKRNTTIIYFFCTANKKPTSRSYIRADQYWRRFTLELIQWAKSFCLKLFSHQKKKKEEISRPFSMRENSLTLLTTKNDRKSPMNRSIHSFKPLAKKNLVSQSRDIMFSSFIVKPRFQQQNYILSFILYATYEAKS